MPNATVMAVIELSFVFRISDKSESEIPAFINEMVLHKKSEYHHLQTVEIYPCWKAETKQDLQASLDN